MSMIMEDEIKRWAAKRKSALLLDVIQGETTVAEVSRAYGLSPSEVENWVNESQTRHGKCPASQSAGYQRAV